MHACPGFHRASNDQDIYADLVSKLRLTYQWTDDLLLHGISEYSDPRYRLLMDILAFLTHVPRAVMHPRDGTLNLENDFKCYLQAINGISDHLHLLFLLDPNLSVKDLLKNIKGESSHWINQNDFIESKFAWEKGYTAVSVSDSMVSAVERHIQNQKEYHVSVSYSEECRQFFKLHRLQFRALTN